MSDDRTAEIRKRHLNDEHWRRSPLMDFETCCPQTHDDRAWLLAEDERHRTEIERLTREQQRGATAHRGTGAQGTGGQAMSDDLITSLRALAAAQHSDLTVAADAADRIEQLTRERDEARAEIERLRAAMTDMLSGWRYIRETYGDLAGIGWDRVEQKARKALEDKS